MSFIKNYKIYWSTSEPQTSGVPNMKKIFIVLLLLATPAALCNAQDWGITARYDPNFPLPPVAPGDPFIILLGAKNFGPAPAQGFHLQVMGTTGILLAGGSGCFPLPLLCEFLPTVPVGGQVEFPFAFLQLGEVGEIYVELISPEDPNPLNNQAILVTLDLSMFRDGFESGNPNAWDQTVTTPGEPEPE